MTPKNIFALVIRLLGLYFLYIAARDIPRLWEFSGLLQSVITLAFYAGVGWWLLGGAKPLLNRAYPSSHSE